MTIYLVRHAHAGSRGAWTGDDAQRPLSKKGKRQSEHLVVELAERPVGLVFSSPAVRCVDTVAPLADARRVKIDERTELFEGSDPAAAWALAVDHVDEDPVLCSHGDVIPSILGGLRRMGLRTEDDLRCEKGSMWIIELDKKGRVTDASYHPPPR